MPKVFVSYRREDSQDVTGRIYDRLVEYFSPAGVFKDIDDIPLGRDFLAVLAAAISQAGAVLVVIGPTWVSCADQDGRPRLDSPTDFVRLEVQAALEKDLPVIPVLVGRARMPAPDDLPEGLKPLAYRNGLAVRADPDFHLDMERLASALEQWVPRSRSARRPTVNQALGDLAREREAERIDREWAETRRKFPLGEAPRSVMIAGAGCLGVFIGGFGLLVTLVGNSLGSSLLLEAGVLISVSGLGACVYRLAKAAEHKAAETAYRERRAIALKEGKDVAGGQDSAAASPRPIIKADPDAASDPAGM